MQTRINEREALKRDSKESEWEEKAKDLVMAKVKNVCLVVNACVEVEAETDLHLQQEFQRSEGGIDKGRHCRWRDEKW